MATQTTNYEFVKPAGTENADIVIFDNNMDSLDSEMHKIAAALAIIQTGDTATRAIEEGKFVFWKNVLYRVIAPIANGDTLSDANLSTELGGSLNDPKFPETRSVTWKYNESEDLD